MAKRNTQLKLRNIVTPPEQAKQHGRTGPLTGDLAEPDAISGLIVCPVPNQSKAITSRDLRAGTDGRCSMFYEVPAGGMEGDYD